MSQPFIKEKDISIDKSFDCFQILYEWKCMPSCGYAIGVVHRRMKERSQDSSFLFF